MRRGRRVAAAALAAGTLGIGLLVRHAVDPRGATRDAPQSPGGRAAATGRPTAPAQSLEAGDPTSAPRDSARAAIAAGALRAGAGPIDSPVARFLSTHSAREVALFARFERVTGRAAPSSVAVLVERRRAGASRDELRAEATRLFVGDPLGRAAVLDWLREGAGR